MDNQTQAVEAASLALLTGATGPYDGVSARPFRTGLVLGKHTVLADFDNFWAGFAGSGAKAVVWTEAFEDDAGRMVKQSQNLLWVCTADPAAAESIAGIAYFNAAVPPALVGADMFPVPVQVAEKFDAVEHVAVVP